jgi:hypothetical protein
MPTAHSPHLLSQQTAWQQGPQRHLKNTRNLHHSRFISKGVAETPSF